MDYQKYLIVKAIKPIIRFLTKISKLSILFTAYMVLALRRKLIAWTNSIMDETIKVVKRSNPLLTNPPPPLPSRLKRTAKLSH